MTLTINSSGTQTAVITTEHVLATVTTVGTYVLIVDTTNLAAGDIVELRLYLKTLGGSTSHLAYLATFTGAQTDVVKVSIPVPTTHEVKGTLKQTVGTGRNFDWELIAL